LQFQHMKLREHLLGQMVHCYYHLPIEEVPSHDYKPKRLPADTKR